MNGGEVVAAIRNPPLQKRSRALLETILTSAGEAFDELGVEGCPAEEISRRAGVSIGALYRFFPNKAAIAATLAQRYFGQHYAVALRQFSDEALNRPAGVIIRDFIADFAALLAQQPGWQGLTRSGYLFGSRERRRDHTEPDWLGLLERFFQAQTPALSHAEQRRAARTFAALTGWLLLQAAQRAEPLEESLQEAETVMTGYVCQLNRRPISCR